MSGYSSSSRNGRRDRGVALPSPVAAISIVAIVVAAIAFAVTGFGGSKTKVIPNAAPTRSVTVAASATPTSTQTHAVSPTSTPSVAPIDKKSIHVSFYNDGTVSGLAKDVAATANKAGWTDTGVGTRPLSGAYTVNSIYYPPQYAAAAKQLGLDLGIPAANISPGASSIGNRLVVVLFTKTN